MTAELVEKLEAVLARTWRNDYGDEVVTLSAETLRSAAAALRREGWRDIADAPKDGTPILLLSAAYTDPADQWGGPYYHPARVALGKWNPDGTSWVDEHGFLGGDVYDLAVTGTWSSGGGWFQPNEVTHFMPLPPPPSTGGGEP